MKFNRSECKLFAGILTIRNAWDDQFKGTNQGTNQVQTNKGTNQGGNNVDKY